MSLYKKYRPNTLEEVYGNEAVIQGLQKLLTKKDKPHSYLFTGGTGCGKTTLARIVAKELGAVGSDYRELNSSDFRGIDSIREIFKQMAYKPLEGACRVFLLDEVHKLTNDAQNALLKALEDTPPHVYFILATTEPEKLISTVKGRCQIFTVTPLNEKELYKLLRKITKSEDETLEKEVYDQIIQDSQGHPRNAIQILEQVFAVEVDKRLEVATKKAEEYNQAIELCRALVGNRGWKAVASILTGLKQANDAEGVRRAVLGYCTAILLKGSDNRLCGLILEEFKDNFYDSGFAGLVYACYAVTVADSE